jgi:hypothetical protein
MELDDLKSMFRGQGNPKRSPEEMATYLRLRSSSVIEKIRRSIVIEFTCAILFMLGAIAWLILTQILFYKALAIYVIVSCAFFIFYLTRLNKRISRSFMSQLPVVESLKEIIRIMETFLRLYFWLTMAMMPVVFVIGLLTINTGNKEIFTTKGWTIYTAWFVGWTAFMYFFTKWYLRKLYGKYMEELKNQLKELEND